MGSINGRYRYQMSVARLLMATFDYLVGTLGGASMAAPSARSFAGERNRAAGGSRSAVTPLADIAAINLRFSVAPITAIIVLLIPTMTYAIPFASALDRVIEVALGGVTGDGCFLFAAAGKRSSPGLKWLRLSEQDFRFDRWSICRD